MSSAPLVWGSVSHSAPPSLSRLNAGILRGSDGFAVVRETTPRGCYAGLSAVLLLERDKPGLLW